MTRVPLGSSGSEEEKNYLSMLYCFEGTWGDESRVNNMNSIQPHPLSAKKNTTRRDKCVSNTINTHINNNNNNNNNNNTKYNEFTVSDLSC